MGKYETRSKKEEKEEKDEIGSQDQPTYAVYIFDGCEFVPVSFGDSEAECQLWIKSHKDVFHGKEPYIGKIMDSVIFL